jgi:hypothetical protein
VRLIRYLAGLTTPRLVLWCYLLWYLVVAARYFDPNPRLWMTSLGLSLIIGFALILNARIGMPSGRQVDKWQAFRFFMMPFCVSSFAALVKGRGFFLVLSPNFTDVALGVGACAGFMAAVYISRLTLRSQRVSPA